MSASKKSKDYVHKFAKSLVKQMGEGCNMHLKTVQSKEWESAADRSSMISVITDNIPAEADLITLQIGENITDNTADLVGDYTNLINAIRAAAPNARIMLMGGILWPTDEIESAKQTVCSNFGITYVDMASFLADYESTYRNTEGAIVQGEDGAEHAIDNMVVAAHPNDAGMKYIAKLLLAAYNG